MMHKITNIDLLGTDYTVADASGNVLKIIQIITQDELLEAAVGEYKMENFASYNEYIEKSREALLGLDKIDFTKIMWYATIEDEVTLSNIIEYAIKNGYDKIILEHLDEIVE